MKKIKRLFYGKDGLDGAGVKLVRCFSRRDIPEFDPFLMMDFFDSDNYEDYIKGFPLHPHRGIETITYLIEGEIKHKDTLGNQGTILDGDCQWMSAGSGILHEEMPQKRDRMLGTQIWLNLPKEHKMSEPNYREIKKEDLGVYKEEGLEVNILAGDYKGVKGPIFVEKTRPVFLDIALEDGAEFKLDTSEGMNYFLFIVRGNTEITGQRVGKHTGVLFERDEQSIVIRSKEDSRIFLLAGKPLEEPVAWGGPIVMNTEEELEFAFRELEEGSFLK